MRSFFFVVFDFSKLYLVVVKAPKTMLLKNPDYSNMLTLVKVSV